LTCTCLINSFIGLHTPNTRQHETDKFPSFPSSFPFQVPFLSKIQDLNFKMSAALLSDPFFFSMESGTVRWADLMMDEKSPALPPATLSATIAEKDDDRIVKWWTEESISDERTQDWSVPDLTLRNDIEAHFPVRLESMSATEDSRERFRVVFDTERLGEWARTRAESHDEYVDYADWVQTRLVYALRQYKYKYTIESVGAFDADYVVIFSMAHPSARRGRAAIPTLCNFPVKWDRDSVDHTCHMVKPNLKRISEAGIAPEKVATDLFDALQQCADCTIELAEAGSPYILIVTIPSALPPTESAHAPPAAPAPRVATPTPAGIRALDVMRANRLAWNREGRKHFIKHRAPEHAARILAELAKCSDCTIELTPSDAEYMCVLTLL
jgi:hypothetical protein